MYNDENNTYHYSYTSSNQPGQSYDAGGYHPNGYRQTQPP